jgi:hypothetical protein
LSSCGCVSVKKEFRILGGGGGGQSGGKGL